MSDFERAARQHFSYFNQAEAWVPNGKPPVLIADMDAVWRYNAARYLVRHARTYANQYTLGEHLAVSAGPAAPPPGSDAADLLDREIEAEQAERAADPEAWITSTPLHQALVDGLPDNVADLAKHWSGCPARTEGQACTCRDRHLTECPRRNDIDAQCTCRDYSPEWTR